MAQGFFRGMAIGLGLGLGGVAIWAGTSDLPLRLMPVVPPASAPVTEMPEMTAPAIGLDAPAAPLAVDARIDSAPVQRLGVPGSAEAFGAPRPEPTAPPVSPPVPPAEQSAPPGVSGLPDQPLTVEAPGDAPPAAGITAQEANDATLPGASSTPGVQPQVESIAPSMPTAPEAPSGPDARLKIDGQDLEAQSKYQVTGLGEGALTELRPQALSPVPTLSQRPLTEVSRPQSPGATASLYPAAPVQPVTRWPQPGALALPTEIKGL